MTAQVLGIGWVTVSGLGRGKDKGDFNLSAGELPRLKRKDIFADAYNRFGRLDDFSRLGLSGVALALQDAGLDQWREKRDIGVIASTRFGCLATDLAFFDTVIPDDGALASPNLFAYTLSNCFLGEAAIRFGLTGTGFVINEDDPERMGGLRMALDSLECGECETIVAGFCDLPAPAEVQMREAVQPGAVFLVLENLSNVSSAGCRVDLASTANGSITIGGIPVSGWPELVQAYLKLGSRPDGKDF